MACRAKWLDLFLGVNGSWWTPRSSKSLAPALRLERWVRLPRTPAGTIVIYCAITPPSMINSEPVTYEDSSDARNTIPIAISSESANLPSGI